MWLSVDEFGDVYVSGKSKPSIMDLDLKYYRIWKRYYVNKSSPDLRNIIVTLVLHYDCESRYMFMSIVHRLHDFTCP